MDIITESIKEGLIIRPDGRLDGYGSGQLEQTVKTSLSNTTRYVIFDLLHVPYMSSAGIRVLILSRKKITRENGIVFLCNVSPFVLNVLTMAGMDKIFQIVPDVKDAIQVVTPENDSPQSEKKPSTYSLDGELMELIPLESGTAVLRVTGSLSRVLHAQISPEYLSRIRFSDCEYSIGLGALAENPDQARKLLGEMITLHGAIVWLPTDGNNVPDFFVPVQDTGVVQIYTGFNAALIGPFHDLVTISPNHADAVSISQLYQDIFAYARVNRPEYSGIVAIALIGETGGIRSSGIIHSPVPERALPAGKTIMDPEYLKEWIEVSGSYEYDGEIIVAFGIGIDLTYDLMPFDTEKLSSLSYIHPANRGTQEMSIHIHGVVFKNTGVEPSSDIGMQMKELLNNGKFLDMRHLMDDSRLRNVRVAVAYISDIVIEE